MPTLDEIRKWARGQDVKGLPKVPEAKKPEATKKSDTAATRAEDFPANVYGTSGCRFSLNPDRTDALLRFGMFRGHRVSELVDTPRGRKWLRWIVDKDDFDEHLRAVCRRHLERYRDEKCGR